MQSITLTMRMSFQVHAFLVDSSDENAALADGSTPISSQTLAQESPPSAIPRFLALRNSEITHMVSSGGVLVIYQ